VSELGPDDDQTLSEAIVVWTHRGRSAWPRRDDSAIVERFGPDRAARLIPSVHRLADDLFSSDASKTVVSLVEMGDVAAAEFRERNPAVTTEADEALTWLYTFSNK
jgi:hypothetical protein